MNYSTYRFTLDIHKTKSQVSIPVLYMDTGIQFLISLTDGGKPYIIDDGCLAVFYGKKADGTTLVTDCEIIDNTRINYIFDDQTTTAEGEANCEIRLYSKEGRLITTPAFDIVVNPRVVNDEDIIPSDSERSAIDRLFETEAERVEAEKGRKKAEEERKQTFQTVFIRYSAYADGTDYTVERSEGQDFIGIANAAEEPKDKSGYTWGLIQGNVHYATFPYDSETGCLYMETSDEYNGAKFAITDDGYMEVIINE